MGLERRVMLHRLSIPLSNQTKQNWVDPASLWSCNPCCCSVGSHAHSLSYPRHTSTENPASLFWPHPLQATQAARRYYILFHQFFGVDILVASNLAIFFNSIKTMISWVSLNIFLCTWWGYCWANYGKCNVQIKDTCIHTLHLLWKFDP